MITDKDIEKSILSLTQSANYRPLKPKAIAKKLGFLGEERAVKKALKRLIKKGLEAWGPKHLVLKVDGAKAKKVQGRWQ